MAKMIPAQQDDFNNSFGERQVFLALQEGLPDEYTVFHSFRWNKRVSKGQVQWGEADFTVFHPLHGILVIEVKSGGILLEDGKWFYERTDDHSRYPMKDPLEQANRTKYILKDLLDDALPNGEYCWIEPVVWFPSIKERRHVQDMPNTYHPEIVLMEWALHNTRKAIENAYQFYDSARRTSLSKEAAKRVARVLSPAFHVVPSLQSVRAEQEHIFLRLTNEQNGLLDYLDEQVSAAIQGGAGTGKTLLAVEKAKRLAADGRVLFLCFNRFLVEELREKNQGYAIDFYNLPSLVKSVTGLDGIPTDVDITEYLNHYDTAGSWCYDHIIIDEGQDFNSEHLDLLATIAGCSRGVFYVFYDKHQLIQRPEIPLYLQNAECRLLLRRNCRNTRNIAITASRSIAIDPIPWENLPEGKVPRFYLLEDTEAFSSKLAELVAKYVQEGITASQIVVITAKTEKNSLLANVDAIGKWPLVRVRHENGIFFTTVRKFKGLEADAVILVDVDEETFSTVEQRNLFYVGTSRAKHFLDVISVVSGEGIQRLAGALTGKHVKSGVPQIAATLKVHIAKS